MADILWFPKRLAQTDFSTLGLAIGALLSLVMVHPTLAQDAILWRGEAKPCTQDGQVQLSFRIRGVRSDSGNVTITVYGDRPEDFLAPGRRLARIRVPSRSGVVGACMAVPARPAYAVAVYHDENDDHDFNRTFFGLPKEGFGFSRDPETTIGIPAFDSVKIEAGPGTNAVTVTLRYP